MVSPLSPSQLDEKTAKWLPLYRRLMARLIRVPGLELVGARGGVLEIHRIGTKRIAAVYLKAKGLEIGFALPKAVLKSPRLHPSKKSPKWVTHRVLIQEASEIDEELLTWIKAASSAALVSARGRSARRRST